MLNDFRMTSWSVFTLLVLFSDLEAFESSTTCDWLIHVVKPVRSRVTSKSTKLGDKECPREWSMDMDLDYSCI